MILFLGFSNLLDAQNDAENSKIDIMLVNGDYRKVIDTCHLILAHDSLSPETHFKLGLAYQNLMAEDQAISCFSRAVTLCPGDKRYSFMLAKSYYLKGKNKLAQPLLNNLCNIDSMNWLYAYYLTNIYTSEGKYDESLKIFKRFYEQDSTNYIYLDKIAYANLKKGELSLAAELYNRSLALNRKNLTAVKNLAHIYTVSDSVSKAIQLLSDGIKTDPAEIDLFVRRAQIYYTINYNKKALDDYLVILGSGDSLVTYLKRAGIGYSNNLQPDEAIKYLLKAYNKDSSDYETCSYLGQNYSKLEEFTKSIRYFKRVIKILTPITLQTNFTYVLLGEALKADGKYNDAITYYLKAQELRSDPSIDMIIANIYDEHLNNKAKAIFYYQLFLDKIKNDRVSFAPEYVETIKKRLDFLKKG
jgi:tetratricopeptide (TPR) repeat protein